MVSLGFEIASRRSWFGNPTTVTMAFENLLKPAVILLPALIILYVIYVAPTLESSSSALKQLPWVGRRSELFSKRRAIWRSLGNARKLLEDSYSKV